MVDSSTDNKEQSETEQMPLWGRLIVGLVMLGIGLGVMPFITSSTNAIAGNSDYSPGIQAMASTMPIMYTVIVILCTFNSIMGYSRNTIEESVDDYWVMYGNRLKLAYASKFGYENNGFNQEVDQRVGVMMNNGAGFTRGLAKNWLKRMHRFTESK